MDMAESQRKLGFFVNTKAKIRKFDEKNPKLLGIKAKRWRLGLVLFSNLIISLLARDKLFFHKRNKMVTKFGRVKISLTK